MSLRITHSRVQHGVGQGSFHSASVEVHEAGRCHRFDYVYDCGALSGRGQTKELKRAIKRMDVDRRPDSHDRGVIDLLVLSHYDQDHINGAKDLVAKCNVRRIVVPYVGTEELALVLASQAADISAELVGELHGLANGSTTLFGVEVTMVRAGDGNNNDEDGASSFPGDNVATGQATEEIFPRSVELNVGTTRSPWGGEMSDSDVVNVVANTISQSPFWKLRFWNRGVDSILLNLVRGELAHCGFPLAALGDKSKVKEVTDWLSHKANRAEALGAYLTAIANYAPTWQSETTGHKLANFLSLAMYSGPCVSVNKNWELLHAVWLPSAEAYLPGVPRLWRRFKHWHQGLIDSVGWLGTGDAPLGEAAIWAEFASHFKKELYATGTVLVPHHGAAPVRGPQFYNTGLHPRPGMLAVISAGKNNSYGHPRASVIKQLMLQDAEIQLVTEDSTLGLHEVFEFAV